MWKKSAAALGMAGAMVALAVPGGAAADELYEKCTEKNDAGLCKCIDQRATDPQIRVVLIDSLVKNEKVQDPKAYAIVDGCLKEA